MPALWAYSTTQGAALPSKDLSGDGQPGTPESDRAPQPEGESLTLPKAVALLSLRKAYRAIAAAYRGSLLRDALDLIPYEARLDDHLKQLRHVVLEGRYTPAQPAVVRAAKRDGMTRPLAFLEISDAILLKTLADRLAPSLHRDFPSCVGFSRSERPAYGESQADYEAWFPVWLRHREVVKGLARSGRNAFIVESDISNFFASIPLAVLRQLVARAAHPEDQVINLLFIILEAMVPRPDYAGNRQTGLPQEEHDSSRVLAHAFLRPVDLAFTSEIRDGRYTRWVDDFVIRVTSVPEGRKVLHKLQCSLEAQGLYPNTGKSCITPAEEYLETTFPRENRILDRVHEATTGDDPADPALADELEELIKEFTASGGLQRPNGTRILKRMYTESRRVGSALLEQHARSHLVQYPDCAERILSYLSGRPYKHCTFLDLLEFLRSIDNVYDDIEIRIYEFLLSWSLRGTGGEADPCTLLADSSADHLHARKEFQGRPPLTPQTQGLICLVLYKYGEPRHIGELAKVFSADRVHDPAFARYALSVLAGTSYSQAARAAADRIEDRSMRRLQAFLTAVEGSAKPYERLLRKHVACEIQKPPRVTRFPARMLPLVRVVARDDHFRDDWRRHLDTQIRKLSSTAPQFRDERSIAILRQEAERS